MPQVNVYTTIHPVTVFIVHLITQNNRHLKFDIMKIHILILLTILALFTHHLQAKQVSWWNYCYHDIVHIYFCQTFAYIFQNRFSFFRFYGQVIRTPMLTMFLKLFRNYEQLMVKLMRSTMRSILKEGGHGKCMPILRFVIAFEIFIQYLQINRNKTKI